MTGVYTLTGGEAPLRVAANLASPEESNLTPASELTLGDNVTPDVPASVPTGSDPFDAKFDFVVTLPPSLVSRTMRGATLTRRTPGVCTWRSTRRRAGLRSNARMTEAPPGRSMPRCPPRP